MAKLHDELTKGIPNYPPFNIKKVKEDHYVIEIAVAGFSKSEIDVELAEGKLIVKGNSSDDSDPTLTSWIHKGIADRSFTRTFLVNDQIEVKGAEMINGMLRIFLDQIIPEHKKPKKIEVKEKGEKPVKQLLTEDTNL
jgi:molecular chaperone IbpA